MRIGVASDRRSIIWSENQMGLYPLVAGVASHHKVGMRGARDTAPNSDGLQPVVITG